MGMTIGNVTTGSPGSTIEVSGPLLMKFGKLPFKRRMGTLAMSNFMTPSKIAFPQVHAWERPIDYKMLGNDKVGNCTIADALHLRMNWKAVADASNQITFTEEQAIQVYSDFTGYNGDPLTDLGGNEQDILTKWRDVGILGNKIAGFAAIDVQNVDMVKATTYELGGLYIGLIIPQSVLDDMNNGVVNRHWRIIAGDKPTQNGHAVPVLGYGRTGVTFISWGMIFTMTWDFWMEFVDEAWGIVSPEWIRQSGTSPTLFDVPGLLAESQQLAKAA
jgi:hypothetical protein